jgi:hypothetical protein
MSHVVRSLHVLSPDDVLCSENVEEAVILADAECEL